MDLRVQRGHRRVRRRPPGNRGSSIRIGSPTAEGQKRNPRQLLYGTPVMYLKKKVEKEQKLNTKIKRTKLFLSNYLIPPLWGRLASAPRKERRREKEREHGLEGESSYPNPGN